MPLVGSVHCGQGTSSTKVARNAAEVQGKRAGSSRASAEECSLLGMLVDGRHGVLMSRWRSYPSARPSLRQLQPEHRHEFRASPAAQRLRAHRKVSGHWVPRNGEVCWEKRAQADCTSNMQRTSEDLVWVSWLGTPWFRKLEKVEKRLVHFCQRLMSKTTTLAWHVRDSGAKFFGGPC